MYLSFEIAKQLIAFHIYHKWILLAFWFIPKCDRRTFLAAQFIRGEPDPKSAIAEFNNPLFHFFTELWIVKFRRSWGGITRNGCGLVWLFHS